MVTTNPLLVEVDDFNNDTTVRDDIRTYSVKGAWFKILNTNHKKQGFVFLIPLKHPEYTDELQDTLTALSVGDTTWLTLKSLNKQRTSWRVQEIVDKEIPTL